MSKCMTVHCGGVKGQNATVMLLIIYSQHQITERSLLGSTPANAAAAYNPAV